MTKRSTAVLWLLLAGGAAFAGGPVNLPVYVEESHAGTFYWIIQNLPLNHHYQLVLIDAHSDASEVFNSDAIRAKVRRELRPTISWTRWSGTGAPRGPSSASTGLSLFFPTPSPRSGGSPRIP